MDKPKKPSLEQLDCKHEKLNKSQTKCLDCGVTLYQLLYWG